MASDDRFAYAFERGHRDGFETLSPVDRDLYCIQDFILEFEMSGLSGFFYNRLPELDDIRATVAAMRKHGIFELASLLNEAADLFAEYTDPEVTTTWCEILRRFDPTNRLAALEQRIMALNDYGIGRASNHEPRAGIEDSDL
jgi:hypothetical protein